MGGASKQGRSKKCPPFDLQRALGVESRTRQLRSSWPQIFKSGFTIIVFFRHLMYIPYYFVFSFLNLGQELCHQPSCNLVNLSYLQVIPAFTILMYRFQTPFLTTLQYCFYVYHRLSSIIMKAKMYIL
jgi:hypothetical protein